MPSVRVNQAPSGRKPVGRPFNQGDAIAQGQIDRPHSQANSQNFRPHGQLPGGKPQTEDSMARPQVPEGDRSPGPASEILAETEPAKAAPLSFEYPLPQW